MNETTKPTGDPDETFTWTDDPDASPGGGSTDGDKGGPTAVLETLREAVDDLAERAAPTVREISARAAELTATAAVKAAPLVKRAGEVTADASQKLADKSRAWAADLRTSGEAAPPTTAAVSGETPSDLAAEEPVAWTEAAPPFESTAETASADPAFEPSDTTTDEREGDPPVV